MPVVFPQLYGKPPSVNLHTLTREVIADALHVALEDRESASVFMRRNHLWEIDQPPIIDRHDGFIICPLSTNRGKEAITWAISRA